MTATQILPQERSVLRQLLAGALRTARHFDNSDDAVDGLMAQLIPLEDKLSSLAQNVKAAFREKAELMLTRHARGGAHDGMSISNILDLAAASFGRRLALNKIDLHVTEMNFVFLPTNGRAPINAGRRLGVDTPRFENHLNNVLMLLQQQGITTSDCDIINGKVPDNVMRRRSYHIIRIRRMNCEIAVCDQAEQATYVVRGQPGPIFWASYNKEQLQERTDVTRIIMRQGWENRLWSAMTEGRPVGPKVRFVRTSVAALMPLTEDLILHHALLWAADHDGILPRHLSGDVPGLPGQKWQNWHAVLRTCALGLVRADCKGLHHLFQLYGLKMGKKEHPKKVEEAIVNIKAGKPHGLVVSEVMNLNNDIMLHHALLWAASHNGKLPVVHGGEIPSLPGQMWKAWDADLRHGARRLTHYRGLNHLFQIYGLMIGKKENPDKVQEAVANIKAGKPHGLVMGEEMKLNEDLILKHALLYAAAHDGRLPTGNKEAVTGMPGRTWIAWDANLRNCGGGLTRQTCKGLPHLFRIYGLKTGIKENADVVQKAIENVKAGLPHGLVAANDPVAARPVQDGSSPPVVWVA